MERKVNGVVYGPVVGAVVGLDVVTKLIAAAQLDQSFPRDIVGDTVRLTLVYNPGAAFGIHLGQQSRWIFMALTIGALILLTRLYRQTVPGDWWRVVALALVTGGAIGNLIDRIRSPLGVTDFIDVGIGVHRWPTFNVADMAVSTGAVLLSIVLWREDRVTSHALVPEP
ncbi:MAG: hypothetical protein NVS1B4_05330 [Gemmatimonadaceae bacterium]